MIEFFQDLLRYPFLQYALLTGVLASVACGVVGSFITVRRITSIAGAISHTVLGGMGLARYLQRGLGLQFITPVHGAIFAALLAAIIIGVMTRQGRQREDTVLSAVWAIGMAVGIFFISRTPGYNDDLMSYLFGNILMVRPSDLLMIGFLDLVVVAVSFLFYYKLEAVCFDEEFARLRGVRVELHYILLLCLTALTTVILVQVVGIVMVIALLALPAATAAFLTRRLWHMMILAAAITGVCMIGGLAISYRPNLPAGATIVLVAGTLYLIALTLRRRSRAAPTKGGGLQGRASAGPRPDPRRPGE
jgi:zinc transport system permease protein